MKRECIIPLPPNGFRRPSLISVGPFHRKSLLHKKIENFLPLFKETLISLPSLSLFLIGKGAHHCFSKDKMDSVHLIDFEGVPKDYIFYSNIFLNFGGKSEEQVESLNWAQKIGCPIMSPLPNWQFLIPFSLKAISSPMLTKEILTNFQSSRDSLTSRIHKLSEFF